MAGYLPKSGILIIEKRIAEPANKKSSPQEDLTEENLQGEGE